MLKRAIASLLGTGCVVSLAGASLADGDPPGGWQCFAAPNGGWDCRQPHLGPSQVVPTAVRAAAPEPTPAATVLTPAAVEAPAPARLSDAPQPQPPAPPLAPPAESVPVSNAEIVPALGTAEPSADPILAETPEQPASPVISSTGEDEPARRPPIPARPDFDQAIDWQACTAPGATAFAPMQSRLLTPNEQELEQPVDIAADSAEASIDRNVVTFTGDVRLRQAGQQLYAEQLEFDRNTENARAQGQVLLVRPDLQLDAEQIEYNLNTQQGSASGAEFRLPSIPARGTANQMAMLSLTQSELHQVSFSTCPPDQDDWLLSADRLEIERDEGFATAHDASLRFMDVPILYLPRLSFPIDDKRRSGVLTPTIGYSGDLGLQVAVPYYFNLAPNYDLTVTSRAMSKRGLMLSNELRFLTENSRGTIDLDYVPYDTDTKNSRSSIAINSHGRFDRHLSSDIRFNAVTDDDFLSDFGGKLSITSQALLERAAELRFDTDDWQLLARMQDFQVIDRDLLPEDQPYSRMPQLTAQLDKPSELAPIRYQLNSEIVAFRKAGLVDGKRVDIQPGLSMPLQGSYYHFEPRASVRYTSYRLEKQAAGEDDTPERTAPILSLDSGLKFDRHTSLFSQDTTQTLEPRLYYLWVPYREQDELPLFDTTFYDFNFDSLFRENRFTGADRLGDANQLTAALTTRYLSRDSGSELLTASIGHIAYFRDREVRLNQDDAPLDDNSSALAGEVSAILGPGWRTRGSILWDPHSNRVQQALAQASYRADDDRIVSMAYRTRDDVNTFADLGAVWPITDSVRVIGRWNYSFSENRNLESLAGLEYGECCWKIRGLVRQYVSGRADEQNLTFLLQLELNGLGQFGNDISSVLDDGIYGYRRDD